MLGDHVSWKRARGHGVTHLSRICPSQWSSARTCGQLLHDAHVGRGEAGAQEAHDVRVGQAGEDLTGGEEKRKG